MLHTRHSDLGKAALKTSGKTSEKIHNKTKYILYFNLVLCLFIIAWGAWVRLSGSGAGCGEHWPLCNGEVIPLSPSWKTLTEFTHRFTTGLFGFTVLAQIFFSYKEYGKAHPVRKGAWALLVMTIIESLIGAVLVKRGLVAQNTSSERAWVVGLHLVNTMLLLATFVYSHFYLQFKESDLPQRLSWKDHKKGYLLGLFGLGLILLVSAFGAITALGNTLFPSADLSSGLVSDFSSESPFLIRLRIYHPVLALLMGAFWITLSQVWRPEKNNVNKNNFNLQKWCSSLYNLTLGALGFGLINWLLMAPVWGSLIHLIFADLIWMGCLGLMYRKFHKW